MTIQKIHKSMCLLARDHVYGTDKQKEQTRGRIKKIEQAERKEIIRIAKLLQKQEGKFLPGQTVLSPEDASSLSAHLKYVLQDRSSSRSDDRRAKITRAIKNRFSRVSSKEVEVSLTQMLKATSQDDYMNIVKP